MKSSFLPVALLLLAACSRKDAAPAADTTAAPAQPVGPARVTTVEGFSTPESVMWDAELNVWYVTNINGNPAAKDNNGFISRLTAEGTIDSLRLVAGGRDGVTLHAPKGMALVGDTLWVADIDAVRGFHRRTGAAIATVEFGKQARFLNDIAIGPNGVLYITDTGVEFTAQGANHPGPDRVYTLTGRLVAIGIEGRFLGGPNGIAWDAANNRFVIVSFMGTTVLGWKPGEAKVDTLGIGAGQLDGIAIVNNTILASSWTDSTLSVISAEPASRFITGVPSPADFGVDTVRNLAGIPIFMGNRVEFWRLK